MSRVNGYRMGIIGTNMDKQFAMASVTRQSVRTLLNQLYTFTSFRKCYVQLLGQSTAVAIEPSLFMVTKIQRSPIALFLVL
jgi:hypothetical protein